MPVSIQRWLEVQGFTSNPFEFWEADRESMLSRYFYEPDWFDALCGNPLQPNSAVLFAPRGHGKSSHRLEIARICSTHSVNPALVVEITEYDWLPTLPTNTPLEYYYLQYITHQAIRRLREHLDQNPAYSRSFAEEQRRLLKLHGLERWANLQRHALFPDLELDSHTRRMLAQWLRINHLPEPTTEVLIEAMASYYQHAYQSDLLKDLIDLARAAGFASIYVLIDRIDEDSVTEHDDLAALLRIKPLISNLHIIEYPGFAFKFFLPDTLHTVMNEQKVSRIDERLPTYSLTWDEDELQELLSRRLMSHSRPTGTMSAIARVNRFQDLCTPGADADELLVGVAEGSPRRLIMTARTIIQHHCRKTNNVESKISQDTLLEHLQRSVPLILVDQSGFIWFGNKKKDIRLTSMTYRLINIFWRNRGRYLSRDEVANELYTKGQQPESLDKLVTRLRDQLEPEFKNSKHYIDYVEGQGYRLINYQPDDSSKP